MKPLYILLAATLTTLPAFAMDTPAARLHLAREAIQYNSPESALLSGSSPLSSHPMFQQIYQRLDFKKINEQAAIFMAEQFTTAEIRALLNFMKSPEGRQISMKMPGYQKLVGAMLQNEMKAAFEGLVMQQGAAAAKGAQSLPTGFAPTPQSTGTPLGTPIQGR